MDQSYELKNGDLYLQTLGGLRTWRDIAAVMLEGGPQAVEDLLGPIGVAQLDVLELTTWIPNQYTWGQSVLTMSPVQQWIGWINMGVLTGHITRRDENNFHRVLNLTGRSSRKA